MNLTLFIETSTRIFNIILAEDDRILFCSANEELLTTERDIALLVTTGLNRIAATYKDIKLVVVNKGPGGTNSVRSGVAFANSLGFSMKIPVSYYNSFELMGRDAWKKLKLPVVCIAKSINNNSYLGLYDNGEIIKMKFGKVEDIINEVVLGLKEFVIAGMHRNLLQKYSENFKIHDSDIHVGSSNSLVEIREKLFNRKALYPNIVQPLTESTIIINE